MRLPSKVDHLVLTSWEDTFEIENGPLKLQTLLMITSAEDVVPKLGNLLKMFKPKTFIIRFGGP